MSEQTVRIGQELVRRKLATVSQIRECLSAQEDLRRRGRDVSIGHILVSRGIVDIEDLKEVLSRMGLLALYCPDCRIKVPVADYARSNEYLCNHCSRELQFASNRPIAREEREPTPAEPARDDPLIGSQVGGCVIRRKIASGGMGTVYEAVQVNLGRRVALKVLSDDLANDEVFVRRFLQEAQAAAELDHEHLIHINDAGQADGLFYYTMEYVEGENLNQLLRRRQRLPCDEALEITYQIADALDHAHRKKIIHRDIKPENVMITTAGRVKIADLGLAKKVMGDARSDLTMTGAILGTPYYMAPEQARDFSHADARSDLYSVGVTLYKMLTGELPFTGSSPIEVMLRALHGKKRSVKELLPGIPDDVSDLVDRLMSVDPSGRPASAHELRDEVRMLVTRLQVPG